MRNNIVYEKAKVFARRIILLSDIVIKRSHRYSLADQIFRAGTSIGANIAESTQAQSYKDFIAKMYIALKETAETSYWLELIHDTSIISDEEYKSINYDCTELFKLLSSITKTAKAKNKNNNSPFHISH